MRANALQIINHTRALPHLYGIPRRGSPFFSKSLKRNLLSTNSLDFTEYPGVEHLCWDNDYTIGRFNEDYDDNDDWVYIEELEFSHGLFSSVRNKAHVCSYLHALMDAKCVANPHAEVAKIPCENLSVPLRTIENEQSASSQPTWVHNQTVLDKILSFTSLEDQTTILRAV